MAGKSNLGNVTKVVYWGGGWGSLEVTQGLVCPSSMYNCDCCLQMHHVAVWGSIVFWFVFLLVYSHFWPTFPIAVVMVGVDFKLYSSFVFYCVFLLAPFIAMFPDLLKTV